MNVIELDHLTKRYGASRGIEDVTFSVAEGEIFGFIGPNGAGKSTTIRTMLDLIHPTSGYARILGMDSRADGAKLRQDVGYLPGEVFYYESMRVSELLAYSASFYRADCTERIRTLSNYMELDVSRKIGELSFGNKKKVGIVQGLLHRPKLLLLDEPTSGLDPLMQQKFFALLREENNRGVTIFFSSHILSEVQRLCHRVAIIRDGQIVEQKTIEELRKNSFSRVRLVADDLSKASFAFAGVDALTLDGRDASFIYTGAPKQLLDALRGFSLENLWIDEPSLEEIFMHYYQGGA